MKYAWIDGHRASWPVAVMCEVLKVSRSGFYAWRRRQKSPTLLTPAAKKRCERFAAIAEVFQKSRGIFGYRKLHAVLRTNGIDCSLNTVHADCKRAGIKSITRRKFRVKTTDSNHKLPVAKNVLNRDFTASKPNEKWVTDITYVATLEGWLFVVAVTRGRCIPVRRCRVSVTTRSRWSLVSTSGTT